MKTPLILFLAASVAFTSCSSGSYPGSSNYPTTGPNQYPYPQQYPSPQQYPYPNQYPSGGSNQYPYPNYPTNRGANDQVVVTQDGRILDRNGRVVGTTQNIPPAQPRPVYGSRPDRRYDRDERRNDERYEKNRRQNDNRYEKGRENEKHDSYEKRHENERTDGKGDWKNNQSDHHDRQ